MAYGINIPAIIDDDKWFCEQGTCYQSPNGTLTYAQCKASCISIPDLPCNLTLEACADYNNVLNGTSAYTLNYILTHWVNYFNTLGYGLSNSQFLNILQVCCVGVSRGKMINLTNPTGSPTNDVRIKNK
tara:strand:- start:977 stop:1363 length:387 start_codon:yes stop_codon:yes gene_type:complete